MKRVTLNSKIKILIGILAGICGIIILCLIFSSCSSYSCCYCFNLICVDTGFREVAKDSQKIAEIHRIQVALEMYYEMYGHYPGIGGKDSWKETKEILIKEKLLTLKQIFYEPEYWVSENKKEYVLKALLNTHLEELNRDVDGYPLGPNKVWCGENGEKEREYCIYNTKIKELRLSDFTEAFKDRTLIVVGDNTSDTELQAINEIADYLQKKTGNKPLIKKYSEITEKDKRNHNLIIAGTPKTNSFLEEVYALTDATKVTEEFPGEGKGVLEILPNPWDESKAMLLVEGWDEWGVKAGSERTKRESIDIKEKILIVFYTGSSEQITHSILSKVFAGVIFYKAITKPTAPPGFSIIAVYKGREYHMPDDFNYLMFDYGVNLTDSNAIDLAKAFIIVSRPWDHSQVNFTTESLINDTVIINTYSRINGITDKWRFDIKNGQFENVKREITGFKQGNYVYVEDAPGPWLPGSTTEYYLKLRR